MMIHVFRYESQKIYLENRNRMYDKEKMFRGFMARLHGSVSRMLPRNIQSESIQSVIAWKFELEFSFVGQFGVN